MPFRWQRLRERSGLTARWITLRPTAATQGSSIIVMSSSQASCPRQLMSSVWSGRLLPRRPEAIWTSGTASRIVAARRPGPFFPEVHDEIKSVHNPGSSLLSSVDGADQVGYVKLPPPVEEAVAAHLCPSAAANWRVRNNASLPSKPCRATATLAGKAFSAAGQAASALHMMAILQVYQAKLIKSLDEDGLDPEMFKELRRATDLALSATKVTARAIGRNMGNLVVLDRHLWLTLTELKNSEKNGPSGRSRESLRSLWSSGRDVHGELC